MAKIGDTFKPGDLCPESGIYAIKRCSCFEKKGCTVSKKQYTIPLSRGEKFPPCKNCGTETVWELVQKA